MQKTMRKIDLHEKFVHALQQKMPSKSILVNILSEILKIEKESVYRRLNGKVNFSVNEIGIVAEHLNISLDALMHQSMEYHWIPLVLKYPMKTKSMDLLYEMIIKQGLDSVAEVGEKPMSYGSAFNSLPLEFYAFQPTLFKFMLFKWGHYFIGTDEYNCFSKWEVPSYFSDIPKRIEEIGQNVHNVLFIWDEGIIRNLVQEIKNFHRMHVITTEDKLHIQHDLRILLQQLEQYLKGISVDNVTYYIPRPEVNFYVTSLNIGFVSYYGASDSKFMSGFSTNFSWCPPYKDYDNYTRIRNWLHSLQDISVLISKSAIIERRLFFENQHHLVDSLFEPYHPTSSE